MGFSLLQSNLEIPSVENLQRAFRSVKCLTDFDAHTLSKDAFGILVKHIDHNDAVTLQEALQKEGIETELVERGILPQLPHGKQIHRLECMPESLVIYDPLGRSFPLEWRHIMMVIAGRVTVNEFNRVAKERLVLSNDGFGNPVHEKVREYATRELLQERLILEVILQRAVLRYTVDAEKFNFQYLGERQQSEMSANLALLVQDIVQYAPHVALNRGAYYLRENQLESFRYPSRNAFDEETIWLLYQIQRAH